MNSADVVGLYTQLDNLRIAIWLDGGWAVDALLGEQTRPHDDVDIVIQQKDLPKLRELLERQGYEDAPREDTRPWNFVLGDNHGRLVDVHVITLDTQGNGIYGPVERGEMYPKASLTGIGVLEGHTVKCISPEYLIKFHTGYKPREKDFKDVLALCVRFGIDLPEEYAFLKKGDT
jgi:lincosamide nucleotidyltransferase A/C/D/E